MNDAIFSQIDFGPLKEFLDDDNITEISYSNDGRIHLKSLDRGVYLVQREDINNSLVEKLAFQCASVMGKTFNMAHPVLIAEAPELSLNFVHDSVSVNGIACTIKKVPAKMRLNRETIINEKYLGKELLDLLLNCVHAHTNIIVCGKATSGRTELVKYLASHINETEKIITVEDTLELHLGKIFPNRDIVSMKTNTMVDFSEILDAAMLQNPNWILLSEVRNDEEANGLRKLMNSGNSIMTTIESERAETVPLRLYNLLETKYDHEQFLSSIYHNIQLAVHVRTYMSEVTNKIQREIDEICEFYVDENNNRGSNVIYRRVDGKITINNPSKYLREYLASEGVIIKEDLFIKVDDTNVDTL